MVVKSHRLTVTRWAGHSPRASALSLPPGVIWVGGPCGIQKVTQMTCLPRGLQKDYSKDPRHGAEVACWFVHNNGAGLIDGVYTDYIVPDIF